MPGSLRACRPRRSAGTWAWTATPSTGSPPTSLEEVLAKATSRASILDPFKPYLNQRWNAGVTSAGVLHAELQARGWKGSAQAVRRYLRQFRPARQRPASGQSPRGQRRSRHAGTSQSQAGYPLDNNPANHLDAADATRLAQITSPQP